LIKIWDVARGKVVRDVGVTREISGVAAAAGGSKIISIGQSGLNEWDVATGAMIRLINLSGELTALAASSDGKFAVAGAADNTIAIVDLETGKQTRVLRGHKGPITSVAISTNGDRIASGADDNFVMLWNTSSGNLIRSFGKLNDRETMTGDGYVDMVSRVLFSKDQNHIVSGNADGTVKIWDIRSGRAREINHDDGAGDVSSQIVRAIAISPRGDLVSGSDDGLLKYWRNIGNSSVQILANARGSDNENKGAPHGVALFSASGDRFLVADGRLLTLWSASTGTLLRTFQGHEGDVISAAFVDAETKIASGSTDGTVRFWSVATGELLATSLANENGDWITITPEGFFDASPNGPQLLTVVQGLNTFSASQFFQSLYRPDLVREKLAGDTSGTVRQAVLQMNLSKVLSAGNPPVAAFSARLDGDTQAANLVVPVTVSNDGGGIGKVEFRINGVLVALQKPTAAGGAQFQARADLALVTGDNRIEVVAYNSAGFVASKPIRALVQSRQAAPKRKPRLYVLAVGVNDYSSPRLPALHLAVNDAKDISSAFQKLSGQLYESVNVRTVLEKDVTIKSLDEKFNELAKVIEPEDTFVFFLSGHGVSIRGQFYFFPQDYVFKSGEEGSSAISQEQLQEWFVRIRSHKGILMTDACQSGSLTVDSGKTSVEQYTATGRLTQSIGRVVLAATTDDKPAAEGLGGHGVFTYAVLTALSKADSNSDNVIDVGELSSYVRQNVPNFTWIGWKLLQIPQMSLSGDNFPLAVRASEMLVPHDDARLSIPTDVTNIVNSTVSARQAASRGALAIADIQAGTSVRLIQSKNGWDLVSREGSILGYVEDANLRVAN
jgi:WD40 repeat protein